MSEEPITRIISAALLRRTRGTRKNAPPRKNVQTPVKIPSVINQKTRVKSGVVSGRTKEEDKSAEGQQTQAHTRRQIREANTGGEERKRSEQFSRRGHATQQTNKQSEQLAHKEGEVV